MSSPFRRHGLVSRDLPSSSPLETAAQYEEENRVEYRSGAWFLVSESELHFFTLHES